MSRNDGAAPIVWKHQTLRIAPRRAARPSRAHGRVSKRPMARPVSSAHYMMWSRLTLGWLVNCFGVNSQNLLRSRRRSTRRSATRRRRSRSAVTALWRSSAVEVSTARRPARERSAF